MTLMPVVPPAGTLTGATATPTIAVMRNGAEPLLLPQLAVACAAPAGVRPGIGIWSVSEVVPDAGAGLVSVAGETAMTVFDGCSVSVTVQETVVAAGTPETAAEIKTAVFWAALAGTGTTLGEIVTEETAIARASRGLANPKRASSIAHAATSALLPCMQTFLDGPERRPLPWPYCYVPLRFTV